MRRKDDAKPKPRRTFREPRPPRGLVYLWRWAVDVINGCSSDGMGPRRITWSDLHAWSIMTGSDPAVWEIDAMFRISDAHVEVSRRREDKPHG